MRTLAKNLVIKTLATLARRRIPKQAELIGITGSVGKTTAKEAATKILQTQFKVFASRKNYNSEIGLPLALLEEDSGYSSGTAWGAILARATAKSFSKLIADKIILEMAVDHPGDMKNLLKVVQPKIGVVTAVEAVHLATGQFDSAQEIAVEKGMLIEALPKNGTAILNNDDPLVRKIETKAHRLTFGIKAAADLKASVIKETLAGLSATLTYRNQKTTLRVPILGTHNLYPLLAAIAIGLTTGMTLEKCAAALVDFTLPPGRLNLIAGINNSQIIDGSYNANPASTLAALVTLSHLPSKGKGRKIAVLGQMNELGKASAKFHKQIGSAALKAADLIVGVYGDANIYIDLAKRSNKSAQFFETADSAGDYLRKELKAGDLVLVKGSQNNVRLENCVKKIMREPRQAEKLLCRQ